MILSTSDIKNSKELALKKVRNYLFITLFCLAFGWIYEIYSFGVYSNFMIYAFVFPLLGGVSFWLTLASTKKKIYYNKLFLNCQTASIATFTIGFLFKGVLDIYGTTSSLTNIYWIVGTAFAILAVIVLGKINLRNKL